jgi:hypothetical protein
MLANLDPALTSHHDSLFALLHLMCIGAVLRIPHSIVQHACEQKTPACVTPLGLKPCHRHAGVAGAAGCALETLARISTFALVDPLHTCCTQLRHQNSSTQAPWALSGLKPQEKCAQEAVHESRRKCSLYNTHLTVHESKHKCSPYNTPLTQPVLYECGVQCITTAVTAMCLAALLPMNRHRCR